MVAERARITLSTSHETPNIIVAKQFDAASRYLEIALVDGQGVCHDLTNMKVRLNGYINGRKVFNNAQILDAPTGLAEVELTEKMLASAGTLTADVSIHGEDERLILTTRTFEIQIQPMIRDDKAIEGSNEYGAVVGLFQDVWDMRVIIKGVGYDGDNISARTLHGKIDEIDAYMREQSTAGIVETVGQIKERIGLPSDANNVGLSTLFALIELIISRGTAKSVQRGVVKFIGGTQTINISPINPDKSWVLIDNHIFCVSSGTVYGARLMGLTSTTLLLSPNYSYTSGPYTTYYEASWQVIESY